MENFQFKGFEPNETLRFKAGRAWERIAERAPSDARIIAVVERAGDVYRCAVEIGSLSCPLAVSASHRLPAIAIDKAELALLRRLDRWCSTRFTALENMPTRQPLGLGV